MKDYLCPNCRQKIKIQESKKYQECELCGYEFKIVEDQPLFEQNKSTNSIFAKALAEIQKKKGEKNDR